MSTCFVIQPFDADKFDKRYRDTFSPAIEGAGLEPYRVDDDPAASVPIDAIQEGIRSAAVCFAEISTDNPNVWFELGYAIAAQKPVVMVCSEQRTAFPFDIQHRTIIKYKTDSPSDFKRLQEEITSRLRAALKKEAELDRVADLAPIADVQGLSAHEMVALVVVAENCDTPDSSVSPYTIKRDMDRLGYTPIAVKLALAALLRKRFVGIRPEFDQNGNSDDSYTLMDDGLNWLERNQGRLVLRRDKAGNAVTELTDDDIPF